MTEIEDRGLHFRSYKKAYEFLGMEIKRLQELLPGHNVERCFKGALKEFKEKNPRYFEEEA